MNRSPTCSYSCHEIDKKLHDRALDSCKIVPSVDVEHRRFACNIHTFKTVTTKRQSLSLISRWIISIRVDNMNRPALTQASHRAKRCVILRRLVRMFGGFL